MPIQRIPQETTFLFDEVVFSTADIERAQFVEVSKEEQGTPVLIPSQLTVVNSGIQITGGKQTTRR